MEGRISDIKDRNQDMMQVEEERNLRVKKKMKELFKNYMTPSEI